MSWAATWRLPASYRQPASFTSAALCHAAGAGRQPQLAGLPAAVRLLTWPYRMPTYHLALR